MKLSRLLKTLMMDTGDGGVTGGSHASDPDITSIHYSSRSVSAGGLFVAIPGLTVDGHAFIRDALDRGASAIITERTVDLPVPWVKVADSRKALARVSAEFFDNPSEALTAVGITGTNGKTTTTFLVENMLKASGVSSGVIGTVNYRFAGKCYDNPVTTPESLDLQRILSEMRTSGVTHVAMEVSSHAIDLSRVEGCRFDVVAFTNLTQDHLDYHGTLETYWACKQRLFLEILEKGPKMEKAVAVININNKYGRELVDRLQASFPKRPVITYGFPGESRVHPHDYVQDGSGIRGGINTPKGYFNFHSALVGQHNIENILCATGIGLALALPLTSIRDGINSLANVPGRLEPVPNDTGRFIFVDYAHTPDALNNVLTALSALKQGGRLICVFGCGGDRDRTKRPIMGEIAATHSDVVVVTSDNPRTENPDRIIEEIIAGIPRKSFPPKTMEEFVADRAATGYLVEPDRRKAIRMGLMASGLGDILLIAGKGHETYQIIGTNKADFDDRLETLAAIREIERGA